MTPAKMVKLEELELFKKEIAEGRCLLIDVREKGEFEAGHLPSARTMPLSQVDRWRAELDKGHTVILYCRTQNRSRRCADLLSDLGFEDVRFLEGGYLAWSSRSQHH